MGKSDVLEHKSGNISETRKDRRQVTMEAYRKSPTLFRMVPSEIPYGLSFPKIWIRNSNPKLQSLLSQEREKLRTSTFARTFVGAIGTKPVKNFGKSGRGRTQGSKSFRTPIYRAHRAVIFAVAQLSCFYYKTA